MLWVFVRIALCLQFKQVPTKYILMKNQNVIPELYLQMFVSINSLKEMYIKSSDSGFSKSELTLL